MSQHEIFGTIRTLLATVLAVAAAIFSEAAADNCPPAPNGNQYDVYYEFYWAEGSEDYREWMRRVDRTLEPFYATCKGTGVSDSNSTQVRAWHTCRDPKDYRKPIPRHPSWPAEINYCVVGGSSAEPKPAASAPTRAKTCKSKDIERSWTRKSDGTNISIVGMGRGGGGSGIMNKSASKRWPRHVSKFFRIKQNGDSCEWSAQCTTIHYNTANKGYNFSTQSCTLILSDDKKQLSASGPHGTFTRGGK